MKSNKPWWFSDWMPAIAAIGLLSSAIMGPACLPIVIPYLLVWWLSTPKDDPLKVYHQNFMKKSMKWMLIFYLVLLLGGLAVGISRGTIP